MTNTFLPEDLFRGPRFGVEPEPSSEPSVFRPTLYNPDGSIAKIGAMRLPYGAAFETAMRWASSIRTAKQMERSL